MTSDLDLQQHQNELARREYLDHWSYVQANCPEFLDYLSELAKKVETRGLLDLYDAQGDNERELAKAQVIAGRALRGLFNRKEQLQQEQDMAEETATENY